MYTIFCFFFIILFYLNNILFPFLSRQLGQQRCSNKGYLGNLYRHPPHAQFRGCGDPWHDCMLGEVGKVVGLVATQGITQGDEI